MNKKISGKAYLADAKYWLQLLTFLLHPFQWVPVPDFNGMYDTSML